MVDKDAGVPGNVLGHMFNYERSHGRTRSPRLLEWFPRNDTWSVVCLDQLLLRTKATLTPHISLHLPDRTTFLSVVSEH